MRKPGIAHLKCLPTGEARYFCTCHPRADGWSLAEVYAAMETGDLHPLSIDEEVAWQRRLLQAAGVLPNEA